MNLRILLLLALTLLCFAGNSLLNRAAIATASIDPQSFAFVRVLSGAAFLLVLASARGLRAWPTWADVPGVLALSIYMGGFSFAYVALDAGLGALILFGVVQVLVIGASFLQGSRPGAVSLAGLALAGLGLVWLLGPQGTEAPAGALFAMVSAGAGWGVYTLLGRGAQEPLARTARNFLGAIPLAALLLLFGEQVLTLHGLVLAAISGALTSGAGYALWYAVLPRLSALTSGTSQLLVPPLTAGLGALLLGETITLDLVIASAVILGGVALTFRGRRERRSTPPR